MVNYSGVMSGQNASLVSQVRQRSYQYFWNGYPLVYPLYLFQYFVLVSYIINALLILSLVIDMRTLLLGLKKDCGPKESKAVLAPDIG